MELLDVYILYKLKKDSEAAHAAQIVAREKFGAEFSPDKALIFVLNQIGERLAGARIENALYEFSTIESDEIDRIKKNTLDEIFSR